MPKYKIERIKLTDLVLDPELQMRSGVTIDADHVESMVQALGKRKKLPRPKVRRVTGRGNLVTDGFHGVTARLKVTPNGYCECDVVEGQWIDAVIDAAESGKQHADCPKKWSNADKRSAVKKLVTHLKAEGVRMWGKSRIAEHIGVSDTLVADVMKGMEPEERPEGTGPEKEVSKQEPKLIERKDGTLQKASVNKPKPNGPKTFNWQVASSEMGLVQRMPDRLKECVANAEGLTEFQAYTRLLGEVAESFDKLKKAVTKEVSK